MTKRELLDALEALRAVTDELPADADISSVQLDDMGLGCVRTTLLLRDDIEEAAVAFGVSQVEVRAFTEFNKVYFNVGGVSVVQYRERREDEEAP